MTSPDTTPAASGSDRFCAFRRCRAALPPPTGRPGNRPNYCQDGKTWGSLELTCKAAEAALVAADSLQGGGPVTPPGVQELGERFAGFVEAVGDPLRRLLEAVAATRHELDEDVLAAYRDRDAAQAQAAADRGAREAAEQDAERARADAELARAAAAAADVERAAAVRGRDAAQAAARAAERAQLRAEGQLVERSAVRRWSSCAARGRGRIASAWPSSVRGDDCAPSRAAGRQRRCW
jgi:hypothetical protein